MRKIRDAIDNQTEVTVQLINYTKSGMLSFAILNVYSMKDSVHCGRPNIIFIVMLNLNLNPNKKLTFTLL